VELDPDRVAGVHHGETQRRWPVLTFDIAKTGRRSASLTIRLFAWADEAKFVGQHDGLDAVAQTQVREWRP
jgi:hypothetical protein